VILVSKDLPRAHLKAVRPLQAALCTAQKLNLSTVPLLHPLCVVHLLV
jgi:hypothetical protein